MEKKTTVTIEGGVSYKSEIDLALAVRIIGLCVTPSQVQSEVSQSGLPTVLTLGGESPGEYFNRHAPQRNPDKIAVLAGYLAEIRAQESFHPNEIRALFRQVNEIIPANFTRDVGLAVKNGWISVDPNKKDSFYLTRTGREALAKGFPRNAGAVTKGRAKRAKRSGSKDKEA